MSDDFPITNEEWAVFAATNIIRIRTDPVWFAETICNLTLDIWQKETLEAMADVIRDWYNKKPDYDGPIFELKTNPTAKRKFTIRAMHGPGKTFLAALAIVWFFTAFQPDRPSPATAPTIKQLKDRLWPCIRNVQYGMNEFFRSMFEVRSTTVIWNNNPNWKVVAETGAKPENVQGYHANFMLIVVDEASGVDEEIFPVIESSLSVGIIVLLLLIGNPTKNMGTFADSHLKEKVAKYYHKIHVDLSKTTRVPAKWVKEMGEKYGVTSPVYQVRCLGEFADEDENQLMSLSWLESARIRAYRPDGSIPRQRLSIDVSDGGANFTVITHSIRYQSFTFFKKQKQYSFAKGIATTKAANEAKRWFTDAGMRKENGDDIVVDSIGVGTGVTSELVSAGYPVIMYKGGAVSDDPKLWRCRRVQSYMVLRDNLRDGTIVMAEDFVAEDEWDDFDGQMCSIKGKPGIEKVEDLLTKKEMIDKGIMSPDRADSMAMSFATQQPVLIPGVLGEAIVFGAPMESASYDASISY